MGRSCRLDEPGDFVVREIAGESLIVTRDRERALHAFYNVCRHRGTRMCTEESGSFKGSIQCPYHAWTYSLDGSLIAARNMEETADFNASNYPLRQAAVIERAGFLFAALDPAKTAFDEFERLCEGLGAWQLPSLRSGKQIVYDVACNWKLIFQNYSECYHCPVIHPQLEKLSPSDSGVNDFDEGPILGGYSLLRESASTLSAQGTSPRAPLGTVAGEDLSRVYYYTVFPSLLLSLHPDYAMAHYVEPLAANRTRITCEWLFAPGVREISDAVEFWDLTNRQDWRVNELTQLGVASRAYTPGPYSDRERLLAAFDRHYLNVMR